MAAAAGSSADLAIRDAAPQAAAVAAADQRSRPRERLGAGAQRSLESAARGRRHLAALRRRAAPDRRQLRHPQGRDPRHHRPERRRQVVDAQRHQRLLPAPGRRDPLEGPRASADDALPRPRARDRPHVPEHRPVQGHDGPRQHHGRPHAEDARAASSGSSSASGRRRARSSRTARRVEEIIDFLEIEHIRRTPVGKLPYGLQKRVELARALAMEPDLLLLDEPMAGMNLEEKEDMSRFILEVNEQFGTTIALIEHDIGVVMDLSDRIVVLDYGQLIADGTPERGGAATRP